MDLSKLEIPERKYKKIGKTKVAYRDMGTGYPVFCFPGWPASSIAFVPLANLLGDRFRLIALDFPGWGGGTKTLSANSISQFTVLAKKFVTSFGFDDFAFVGNSLGCLTMLGLLPKIATKPQKIVFLSGFFRGRTLVENEHFSRLIRLYRLQTKIIKNRWLLKAELAVLLYFVMRAEKGYAQVKGSNVYKQATKEIKMLDPYSAVESVLSAGGVNFSIKKLNLPPTLIVYVGSEIDFVEKQSEELAAKLGTATHKLADASHSFVFFEPEKVSKLIADFLSSPP